MRFTEKSALVKVWVSLVLAGTYKKEDVPNLFNLKEVVCGIIDGMQ